MKRKHCRLLPHIKEPIYGLKTSSAQVLPWAMMTFNVMGMWPKTNGSRVNVAVIDTGCDLNHDDIKDNLIPGQNIINPNKDPIDGNGHGTHVAGTIAAINNSLGVVGVSPETKIMPVKALNDDGSGSNDHVAEAIIWACDNGADILTMSLGSDYPSIRIERALIYAQSKGVVIFCAAGNSGIKHDVNYPARYSYTISIGAIDRRLNICKFSCTGDTLDFLAPGEDIISTTPGNSYSSMSGTSMATPFAVGCASLYLSYIRKTKGSSYKLSREDYIDHFAKTAKPLADKEYSGIRRYEGNGIIVPSI